MKRLLSRISIIVFVPFTMAYGQSTAASGQINGAVQGPDGHVLSGATVRISALSPSPVFNQATQTAPDGTFQFTGVPAGKFVVCPSAAVGDLLSPCASGLNGPIVTVAGGQSVTVPPIKLAQGYRLQVQINDPGGYYAAAKTAKKPVAMLVSASFNGGLPVIAQPVSSSTAGITYEVVVPFDTPVRIISGSLGVEMKDGSGATVPWSDAAGTHHTGSVPYQPATVQVPSGKTVPAVTYSISNVP
jgi:hypothetical protein